MAVDVELVRRKARLILEDLDRLEAYGDMSLETYRSDVTHTLIVERLLERIIGRMIDMNYHLAVGVRGLPPKDYHESFVALADLGVLGRSEAKELASIAGLRNRLAHEYNGIDDALVHQSIRRSLTDVPAYLRAVETFVAELEEPG